jgi:predicted DNA-binding transcriptional regulator AlpA
MTSRLLTIEEVAEILRVPVKSLYEWRYRRIGPPAFRIGRFLRYDEGALREWIRQQQDQDPAARAARARAA